MAIKKSDLYSSLWKMCDELRGGMDASQYKDYVLVLLFVKYVSDKYAGQKKALISVPEGGGFADMVALAGNKEIGDKINKIIAKLAEANGLRGVIDVADFNDEDKLGKGDEMVQRLSNLVKIFDDANLDFRSNRADGDDLLGDAYEYLMRHFATESGKSKGQFYTPAEVSTVMAQLIDLDKAKDGSQTICDMTCGSGSLLLKAHDYAKNKTGIDLTLYGQEMDNATSALAKMNMILHDCPTAEIWKDNTLSSPHFKNEKGGLKTFDFGVANPPFSFKSWSTGLNPEEDLYGRFEYGIPPEKNGDYAFLLHFLTTLKSTGKGCIVMPHAVLFRSNTEARIRANIIKQGFIKGIVGLPSNLFYGTSIPACLIVFDKANASARKGIFMMDASKGFIKDGNKNRLRAQDIHKIVDTFTRQIEIPGCSRMVPVAEISDPKNDYNLNFPRYIDNTEKEDFQDIDAHLNGGIPNRDIDDLDRYWKVIPSVRSALFKNADRPGYCQLNVAASEVKSTIFEHPEFTAFNATATELFTKWRTENSKHLMAIAKGTRPKDLIQRISEALLSTFEHAPLVDPYNVYQHLMDYWSEPMQDDCYLIAAEGWHKAAQLRLLVEDKAKKSKVKPDFTIGKKKYQAELIPPAVIIARYYAKEQEQIDALEAQSADLQQQLEVLVEEHSGESGLLEESKNDKDKLTKASVAARLKSISMDKDAAEERKVLKEYLSISEQEADVVGGAKLIRDELMVKVAAKYGVLTEDEIKVLVVTDKWLAALAANIRDELDRVSASLTARIRQLAERYATPLPQLIDEWTSLSTRVSRHLGVARATQQATIQQLLTGQTRIAGFQNSSKLKMTDVGLIPEDWSVETVGEIASVGRGRVISHREISMAISPLYPVYSSQTSNNGIMGYLDTYDFEGEYITWTTDGAHAGTVFHRTGRFNCTNVCGTIKLRKDNAVFVSRVLGQMTPPYVSRHLGNPKLMNDVMKKIPVPLPPSLAEQSAIAAVAADIDAEITALDTLLAKKCAIRVGMMQELLTGRTRLN